MKKTNRETARARANSVEQDRMLGPIIQKEIFYKQLPHPENGPWPMEVRIFVSVYKYCILVEQFDTTSTVWGVMRDGLHSVWVEAPRRDIDKRLLTNDPKKVADAIEKLFNGPFAVQRFATYCRQIGVYFTIHEDGPVKYDLIRMYYTCPLNDNIYYLSEEATLARQTNQPNNP